MILKKLYFYKAIGYLKVRTSMGKECDFSIGSIYRREYTDTCTRKYQKFLFYPVTLGTPWCATKFYFPGFTEWGWCQR